MVTIIENLQELNIEEAGKEYEKVKQTFNSVAKQYSTFWSIIFFRTIKIEHIKSLDECIGILYSLSLQSCVLRQVKETNGDANPSTLLYKIRELISKITDFYLSFRNTNCGSYIDSQY